MAEWPDKSGHPYWGGIESNKEPTPPPSRKISESGKVKEMPSNTPIGMHETEKSRTYHYPRITKSNGDIVDAHTITIHRPTKLTVRPSGSHIVEDSNGVTHYVASGWTHLSWEGRHEFNVGDSSK